MKRISFALAAAAVIVALAGINHGAAAQPGPGAKAEMGARKGAGKMGKMDPEMVLKRMETNLGLSAEQKEKIRPILQDEIKEMEAVRADAALTRAQKREKMREIRDRKHRLIGEHLTVEQRRKADAQRDMAKKRWEKSRETMKGPQKPAGGVK
uniref:CpxP superfamily protein n=1 Tax=Geobacter metallireducens TaxID=28232 RepID=A0A831TWN1_GEOME